MECTYRYAGAVPRYTVLKRQGYLVLILEKAIGSSIFNPFFIKLSDKADNT